MQTNMQGGENPPGIVKREIWVNKYPRHRVFRPWRRVRRTFSAETYRSYLYAVLMDPATYCMFRRSFLNRLQEWMSKTEVKAG